MLCKASKEIKGDRGVRVLGKKKKKRRRQQIKYKISKLLHDEQGRIHGHQLRTGGQGRKCAFSHFPTRSLRTDGPTDQRTNGPTDQRTDGRTDKASNRDNRVACPQLKRRKMFFCTVELSCHHRSVIHRLLVTRSTFC